MTDPMLAVAQRLFNAIEVGDLATVRDIMAPDVKIWHNYDPDVVQTREECLRALGFLVARFDDVRYDDIRLSATSNGFVQQHTLRATTSGGRSVVVPACIVCICADGRITRLDEYFDSVHLAALVEAAATTEPASTARRRADHAELP